MMSSFNGYGLLFVIIMMIPNILAAAFHRTVCTGTPTESHKMQNRTKTDTQ